MPAFKHFWKRMRCPGRFCGTDFGELSGNGKWGWCAKMTNGTRCARSPLPSATCFNPALTRAERREHPCTRMKTLCLLIAVVASLFASLPLLAADDATGDPGTVAEKFYAGYVAQVEANPGDHSRRLIILTLGSWQA